MKKKNNKNKKYLIIIGIVLLIVTIISVLVINITKERKNLRKNIEIIEYNYNELKTNVEEYNQIRTELSTKLNDFIYDKYASEHESYTTILTNYNNVIKNIDKNISNLDDKCNVIYSDLNINKICDSYKITYEKLINLYISDLTNYNNKINSYNEYKGTEINLFELVHKEYIDYNDDYKYEGKDVENEKNNEE